MALKDKMRNLIQQLEKKGLTAKAEAEDRIIFNSGETSFILQLSFDENDYYQVLLPNFYTVKDGEVEKILKLINDANSRFRFVKVLLINQRLWISTESYFESEKNFLNKLGYFVRLSKIVGLEVLKLIKEEN